MSYHLATLSLMSVMSVHFEICVSVTLLLFEKFDVTYFFKIIYFIECFVFSGWFSFIFLCEFNMHACV